MSTKSDRGMAVLPLFQELGYPSTLLFLLSKPSSFARYSCPSKRNISKIRLESYQFSSRNTTTPFVVPSQIHRDLRSKR